MTVLDARSPRLEATDVLVLRALGLGDALTGVAALRGVRRAWPDRRIVLAAPRAVGEWLAGMGVVDAVLPAQGLDPGWAPVPAGAGRGHVAVNLHGRGPQSHRLLLGTHPERLVAFGCAEVGHAGPWWRQEEHEVARWCRLIDTAGGTCGPEDLRLPPPGAAADPSERPGDEPDPVVLHPGAASAARRWPAVRWAGLAQRLADRGHQVLLTGSAGERGLCSAIVEAAPRAVSTAGTLDLAGLARLVARARLVVCGDTGVAHLATAYGTPSVLLFGPTPPAWWGPVVDPERHVVIWHGTGPADPHANEVDAALAQITLPEVEAATEDLLAARVRG